MRFHITDSRQFSPINKAHDIGQHPMTRLKKAWGCLLVEHFLCISPGAIWPGRKQPYCLCYKPLAQLGSSWGQGLCTFTLLRFWFHFAQNSVPL